MDGVGKVCFLSGKLAIIILETVKNTAKVTILITNRKWHTLF